MLWACLENLPRYALQLLVFPKQNPKYFDDDQQEITAILKLFELFEKIFIKHKYMLNKT